MLLQEWGRAVRLILIQVTDITQNVGTVRPAAIQPTHVKCHQQLHPQVCWNCWILRQFFRLWNLRNFRICQ